MFIILITCPLNVMVPRFWLFLVIYMFSCGEPFPYCLKYLPNTLLFAKTGISPRCPPELW